MTDIVRLKVMLRGGLCDDFPKNYCTRTIDISGATRLKKLAQTILESYDFAFDHAFGFYNNLKNYYDSEKIYTLFADMDDIEPEEFNGQSVSKAMVGKVFEPGKTMLFLFDYGDEWIFHVECLSIGAAEASKSYPLIVEAKGNAPEQYPDSEEDAA